jgi:hypothetical protein
VLGAFHRILHCTAIFPLEGNKQNIRFGAASGGDPVEFLFWGI